MAQPYTEALQACFTVLDFETTGSVAGYPVEPWQVGMVRMRDGRISPKESYETFFQIGDRPFNPHTPGRFTLIRDVLAKAPAPGELWPTLNTWLSGVPLVAHNVGTERSVLSRLAPLHRLGPWVDTLHLVRHAYPQLTSNALDEVIRALGLTARVGEVCPAREPHDALYDACACAALLEHLLALPGWEHVTVEALAGF